MQRFLRLTAVIVLASGLGACSAVEMAVEDRRSGDIGRDIKIKTALTANVIEKMKSDFIKIDADVYEQEVLLTGLVETAGQKARAQEISESIEGVKRVYNEILVIPKVEREQGAVEGFVSDTVIEAKIKGLLLDAQGVYVTNYRWRSVRGNVVLFGRALTAAERDKAAGIVQGIKGVRSFKNLVKVKPKEALGPVHGQAQGA